MGNMSNRQIIARACRLAVWPEIKEMRDKIKLPFICPITGEIINDKKKIHVDHYDLKFSDLLDKWLENKDIDYILSKIHIEYNRELKKRCYFVDEKIENDFIDFHNKNTHLRAVSAIANIKILVRQ